MRFFKKFLALVVSTMLILTLIEFGLRLSGYDLNSSPQWRFSRDFGWTLDPDGISMAGTPQVDVQPSGFRHPALDVRKPPGTRRLIVLGDSFSAATKFPYADTYAGLLEKSLNSAGTGRKWQVLNLSSDDWGTAQEYLALTRYGLAYGPDAVVLQVFPFNDFCNNSIALANTCSHQDRYRPYFTASGGRLQLTFLSPWKTALRNRLLLFGWIEKSLASTADWPGAGGPDQNDQRRRDYFQTQAKKAGLDYEGVVYSLIPEQHQPPAIRQAWRVTELVLQRLADELSSRKIPLVVLVVPFSKTFDPFWQDFLSQIQAPAQRDYGTARVESFCESLGIPVISARERILSEVMDPQDYFISPSDGHFSSFGHFRATEWILGELHRQGTIPTLPPPVDPLPADLLQDEAPTGLVLKGFDRISRNAYARWRLAIGPESEIAFRSQAGRELELRYRFHNLIEHQSASVWVNGLQASPPVRLETLGKHPTASIRFETVEGRNSIRFVFEDWNRRQTAYFPNDDRPVAINIIELKIGEVSRQAAEEKGRRQETG